MHCCNGTESRHLINMPFIWPLHSSLKQELGVRVVHPGGRLGRKVQPAKIMRLVCHCHVCSYSPWPGKGSGTGTGSGSVEGPFVYPFVLIYLHVICLAPSLFLHVLVCGWHVWLCVLVVSSVTFARTPVTYGCCVHYQYALYGNALRFIFYQCFHTSPTDTLSFLKYT